jgi:hypothetical protein
MRSNRRRQRLLADRSVKLLDTHAGSEPTETTDLVVCSSPERPPCFVLLHWQGARLLEAELFFTEAEARACLAHGPIYLLEAFALPPAILAQM